MNDHYSVQIPCSYPQVALRLAGAFMEKAVLKPPGLSLLGEGEFEELREGSKHPLLR